MREPRAAVSVIVITYQRSDLLAQCLASIYAQQGLAPFEVLVIDNGGDSVVLEPDDDRIDLIIDRPGTNLGVAGGRNRGMELASGDYLIFIDDDASWHSEGDMARLIDRLDQDAGCGAVAVKSLAPGTDRAIPADLPHPNKAYLTALDEPVEVPYFYGVGHALRASAVRTAGEYPERFFYGMEEIDLSFRLLDAGYLIIYDPAIAVYHHKSDLGRTVAGPDFWHRSSLNKCRMAWRLLPLPYPITTGLVWSLRTLINTRSPTVAARIWGDLWSERARLRAERRPVGGAALDRIRSAGGRLFY